MTSQAGFLGFLLLQFVCLAAILTALADLAERALGHDRVVVLSAAMLAFGLLGYLGFWIAYVDYRLFGVVKIVCLAGLLLHFGRVAYRRELARLGWIVEPLLYTSLFAAAVVTLGFSNGGIDTPGLTSGLRFSQSMPPDNILPMIVADWLSTGRASPPQLGDWLVSDRPPLQTGLYLVTALRRHEVAYQLIGTWLQATFLLGVWVVAETTARAASTRRLMMLACCLLPPVIFNSLYVWPKIIQVAYLLLLFALVFCHRPNGRRDRAIAGVLIGGVAAMAVLCHGGAAFALIGFAAVVVIAWHWPAWWTAVVSVVTFVVLYGPWLVYQRVVDPPGNRLLKWHLGGAVSIDPRSLLETLRDAYGALTWHDYIVGRIANLAAMAGVWPRHLWDLSVLVFERDQALAQRIWTLDFFNLLPSLHVYSLAAIAATLVLPFIDRGDRRIVLTIAGAAVATAAVVAIAIFTPGQAINHQGNYAIQIMATVFAFMVLASRTPWFALLFIALQSTTVVMTYGWMVRHDPGLWPTAAICLAATVALFAYSLVPLINRPIR